MKLSVVIPAHNEEAYLGSQLDALLAEPGDDWEVIVVDNASTDRTAEIANDYAARDSRVRLVQASARADQSYAANAGVAAAHSSDVAFCDADDIVAQGWVNAVIQGLQDHAVVTGPNELNRLNPPWLATSRGQSGNEAAGSFAEIFPLVRGNNYAVKGWVWAEVGPLNEGFFPVADQEFSFRCWLNGIEIGGLPNAVVHYRYRDTARQLWRQGFAYGSGRPRIARLVNESGRARAPRLAGWRSWVMLALRLPTIATRSGRCTWTWIAANRFGQLAGSWRYRTLML